MWKKGSAFMSIFFQYYVLQKILSASYKNAKLPDSTSMPYKTIRPLKRLSKIRKYRIIDKIVLFFWGRQWRTCCILEKMGLIKMVQLNEWLISITKDGAIYAAELKLQVVKSAFTFLLAVFSAVFGFLLGRL